ncbi:MAG: SDR family oxidoreductase [Alicyclobacillaceae bacterium]|nr:SDR family oxidoreductase [Alicyclobacillaceae bacterium]
MRVLVTGGAGFIGSHVVDRLVEDGHEVAVVDDLSTGREDRIGARVAFYRMSVESAHLAEVFTAFRPEAVIHLAAQSNVPRSLDDPMADARINVLGTVNVLEQCRLYGVRKIVYASSAAVYGQPQYLAIDERHPIQPISFYGISKYTPETYIQAYGQMYGLEYTILRYSNVYGPRQNSGGEGGVVSIFVDKLLRDEAPWIDGDGQQTRDFIYVEDVAAANVAALTVGSGGIFNIGTGQETSIQRLWELLKEMTGTSLKPLCRPPRPGDIRASYFDNTKARRELGWEPRYDLREGLMCTIAYYRDAGRGIVEAASAQERK